MPDWSYRTLLRPLLLRLGADRGRQLALGNLSFLARLPGGPWLIDFMGHMRADPGLACNFRGTRFSGPVGLGALVDPTGGALPALSRFGLGFAEIGPVTVQVPALIAPAWKVDLTARTLSAAPQTCSLAQAEACLAAAGEVPVFVRLAAEGEAEAVVLGQRLGARAAGFIVPHTSSPGTVDALREATRAVVPSALILLGLGADDPEPGSVALAARTTGADGVWLRAEWSLHADRLVHGAPPAKKARAGLSRLRAALGPEALLVAGGVLEPADARDLLAAGANLVTAEAGLVLGGPGLIKRTNEALLARQTITPPLPLEPLDLEAARSSWFWLFVLGLAMLGGGVLATVLASTRVVLPYDEALCGLPRAAMIQLNPRLLPFMAHDRMSLAGSMLSIGLFYSALAWCAVRRGAHWAKVAVVVSAMSGFFTFFLFLGFGYFDPFHAFVTAVLLQLVIVGLHAPLRPGGNPPPVEWRETPAWRRAQWGQLIFVGMGVGLVLAGLVISFVGCTSVFVATDLDFLRTTAAELLVAHERLVPLIAHDRASLGGMLIANGLVVWLTAQWGLRAGEAWLWRTFAWAGNLAFAAAIGVHIVVGYMHWEHLAPAFAGWFLWLLALGLTRDWLLRPPAEESPRMKAPYPADTRGPTGVGELGLPP